jgi:hypothetical protein
LKYQHKNFCHWRAFLFFFKMKNENLLSDESSYFFEKLLIKIIVDKLDWQLVIQYFLYLIKNEDGHDDIRLINNLSKLLVSFVDRSNIDQSFSCYSNEKRKLAQFFELLLSFLNQTSSVNLTKLKTNVYTPPLSSENEISNINYLIKKTIQ